MNHLKEAVHAKSSRVTKQRVSRSSLAMTEVPAVTSPLTHRLSQAGHGLAVKPGAFSLAGLLTARKFTKGLRERAAVKLATKRTGGIMRKPVTIVNEKVPAGCAQPEVCFPCVRASQLVKSFLATRLDGVSYKAASAGPLTRELSEELRRLVQVICPERYKLVCTVTVGPAGQEGAMLASRCLWDVHSDRCISDTYQSLKIFCSVAVFAVYYE